MGEYEGKAGYWTVFDRARHYARAIVEGRIDYQYGWPEFRDDTSRVDFVTLHWFMFGAPTADDERMPQIRRRFGCLL